MPGESATFLGQARISDYRLLNVTNEYGQPAALDSAFVSQVVPSAMIAGQPYNVKVTFTNTGTTTWTPAAGFKLSSVNANDNTTWGFDRVILNIGEAIPEGSSKTFDFNVTAPVAGTYNFQWQMIQDGIQRFGDNSTNVSVTTSADLGTNNPPPPDTGDDTVGEA